VVHVRGVKLLHASYTQKWMKWNEHQDYPISGTMVLAVFSMSLLILAAATLALFAVWTAPFAVASATLATALPASFRRW